MKWPWTKTEKRTEKRNAADLYIALRQSMVSGFEADVLCTASVEQAAGALARAFASMAVQGAPHVVAALSGPFLARVGRDLVRHGASMHVAQATDGGRVRLLPASTWQIEGGPADDWQVIAHVPGPSKELRVRTTWRGVVFVSWGGDRAWSGRGPLSYASESARMAANADRSLANELSGPVGSIVPVPAVDAPDPDTDPLEPVRDGLGKLKGGVFMPESTSQNWKADGLNAPKTDWNPARIGPGFEAPIVQARKDVSESLLGAMGTPAALFNPGDGTAAREGLRRYWQATVIPLARMLCEEVTRKLEGECSFRYDPYPLDVTGRSSALKAFVEAGVPLAEARDLVGLADVGVIQ